MKVLMISGSRNPEGQTAQAADALLTGAAKAGAEVERIFLPSMELEVCRQCDPRGWGACRSHGRCVITDDFAQVVETLKAADAAVFATPVYYGDLSETMRAFTDRLRRICTHEDGKAGLPGKPCVGVCVAGGGGGGAPECCVSLKKVLSIIGLDMVDTIAVRRQNLEVKIPQLEIVGEWLASGESGS